MANLIVRTKSPNYPERASLQSGWDPFRVMDSLLRWDPFQMMWPEGRSTPVAFTPRFEVKETKDGYVFKGDLPGIREADIDISLTGNQLTISGKREAEEQGEEESYFLYERSYGSFTRTFTLPEGADMEHLRADLKDGVLTLHVPKKAEAQARKIKLNVAGKGST